MESAIVLRGKDRPALALGKLNTFTNNDVVEMDYNTALKKALNSDVFTIIEEAELTKEQISQLNLDMLIFISDMEMLISTRVVSTYVITKVIGNSINIKSKYDSRQSYSEKYEEYKKYFSVLSDNTKLLEYMQKMACWYFCMLANDMSVTKASHFGYEVTIGDIIKVKNLFKILYIKEEFSGKLEKTSYGPLRKMNLDSKIKWTIDRMHDGEIVALLNGTNTQTFKRKIAE